jgi:hypothetical protein
VPAELVGASNKGGFSSTKMGSSSMGMGETCHLWMIDTLYTYLYHPFLVILRARWIIGFTTYHLVMTNIANWKIPGPYKWRF